MATTSRHRSVARLGHGGSIGAVLFLLVLLPDMTRCAEPPFPSPQYAQINNSSFGLSSIVLIIVMVTSFFLLAFFTVYIRHCVGLPIPMEGPGTGEGSMSFRRGAPVGLSPEILETFPTMAYVEAKALMEGRGALECAVCISEFADDEALRLLPGCCHVFHPDCIDAWLASHITCPVCRTDIAAAVAAAEADSAAAAAEQGACDSPPDHVVDVDRTPTEEEAIELERIGSEQREARARAGRRPPPSKLPRWNSTGHSLAQLGSLEDVDRYTLRLPKHVRREIFAALRFHRSASCAAFPIAASEGSSHQSHRGSAEGGFSRGGWSVRQAISDRWPSFFIRTVSSTVPTRKRGDSTEGSTKKADTEGSSGGRFASVWAPFDWLVGSGARVNAAEQERGLPR
ncbi:E3 ubiquitin-protein ligase [Musa troglodytarum]|uniref:RING-type E3 ubiquitin transferase n=3 Tax=Musa troglodytarum TaxID=320322 RepID=A0A9E7G8I3_9LILI|nr:E3 ubiquitin-protein ligase [Musa troglodytarum]